MQRQLTLLVRNQAGDDGPVTRNHDIELNFRLAFDPDDLLPTLGLYPSLRCQVLTFLIELLDENVLHRGTNVGESPSHAAVVTDDDVRHAGKCDACHVELSTHQVGFVPVVRQSQFEVHVVRQ